MPQSEQPPEYSPEEEETSRMAEDSLEYSILEHASRIADEREEYVASTLSDSQWAKLNGLFESKDKKEKHKNIRMFNIELVQLLGLTEAIFLHQLRGTLKYDSRTKMTGDYRGEWLSFYNDYSEWLKIIPICSKNTLIRAINRLELLEIIISQRSPRKKKYGINFKALLYFVENPKELPRFEAVQTKKLARYQARHTKRTVKVKPQNE